VMTTHYLDEADSMSERVIVIDHGEIIADDTAARLKSNLAGDLLAVEVPLDSVQAARAVLGRAAADGELDESMQNGSARFRVRLPDGARLAPGLLKALDAAGAPVTSLELNPPTLDDVFLELTGRSLREGADV
jgi:ABC-2 type transport system ATP-binding protein